MLRSSLSYRSHHALTDRYVVSIIQIKEIYLPFHKIISTLLLHDDDLPDFDSVTQWLSLVEQELLIFLVLLSFLTVFVLDEGYYRHALYIHNQICTCSIKYVSININCFKFNCHFFKSHIQKILYIKIRIKLNKK